MIQRRSRFISRGLVTGLSFGLAMGVMAAVAPQAAAQPPAPAAGAASPTITGPIPGRVPGDRNAPDVADTYPFFSTDDDLARAGYVEEEFSLSGVADAYGTDGARLAEDVAYTTRIVVRRPVVPHRGNGVVLMEWQNVSAGYDLDALWNYEQLTRDGYTWIGVSAQRVGVDQLRGWSPARYGTLDVTGGGRFTQDELSYDIFAQAAQAVRNPTGVDPVGRLEVDTVLAIGASQSAGRMTVYYDRILPQVEPVFDGYGFIVGSAPTRVGAEPVFHVQSETDVSLFPFGRPDDEVYRRWEVAGAAHSGWAGQQYRVSISERDLPNGAPEYECATPPFSRVPLQYVTTRAYALLVDWVQDGVAPPSAPRIELDGRTVVRDELGLARGGIRLSQVSVPTAVDTGANSGESFCILFGSHVPLSEEQLASLYPNHGTYVAGVARAGTQNVRAGYIDARDALADTREAARSPIGRR